MTLSFAQLGLSESRLQELETLGFSEPTAIQAQAIPLLMQGRDLVGQAQTGTGKTAAFALPLLERVDPESRQLQALVLTPTRELALQVAQAMKQFSGDRRLGILTVYGGQSIERQIQRLERGVQIAVGTPGRILDLMGRGDLRLDNVRFMVLDEADEMLSMGFLSDVESILQASPSTRQTAFFSATMPPSIRNLVKTFLNNPETVTVERSKETAANITQVAYGVPRGWTKLRALLPILAYEDPQSAIIFVRTRRTAAELTSYLQQVGYSVDEYHGDLSQSQRERMLHRFKQGQVRWIVATDIAARGIHVDDLTHVVNYDLPDSMENYVHRIGRTGRAGKEGKAVTLIQGYERRKLRDIEHHSRQRLELQSLPSRSQVEARQLEQFKAQLREALAGERVASFLPIVAELGEDYEPRAIAAAALQMAYDRIRPATLLAELSEDAPDDFQGPQRRSGGRDGGRGERRFGDGDRPRRRYESSSRGDRWERNERGGERRERNDRGDRTGSFKPRPVNVQK